MWRERKRVSRLAAGLDFSGASAARRQQRRVNVTMYQKLLSRAHFETLEIDATAIWERWKKRKKTMIDI